MVDTPKEGDGDEATEDNPLEKQSRHRRHSAALSPAIAKIVIPAPEMITIRMVPKTMPSQASSRPSKKIGKLALNNRQYMENHRMITTCLSPKTR